MNKTASASSKFPNPVRKPLKKLEGQVRLILGLQTLGTALAIILWVASSVASPRALPPARELSARANALAGFLALNLNASLLEGKNWGGDGHSFPAGEKNTSQTLVSLWSRADEVHRRTAGGAHTPWTLLLPPSGQGSSWYRLDIRSNQIWRQPVTLPLSLEAMETGDRGTTLIQFEQVGLFPQERLAVWAPVRAPRGRLLAVVMVARVGSPSGNFAPSRFPWLSTVFMAVGALLLLATSSLTIFRLYRLFGRYQKGFQRQGSLQTFLRRKVQSLIDQHPEIVITVGADDRIADINKVIHTQLGIRPPQVKGQPFPEALLLNPAGEPNALAEAIHRQMAQVRKTRVRVEFPVELVHPLARESRFYQLCLECLPGAGGHEILARAKPIWTSTMHQAIQTEHLTLVTGNSLIQSEAVSQLICRNLPKYLTEVEATSVRIALREILINAMEHGNLAISFDEKTKALEADGYFDLLKSRREDPVYRDRKIFLEVRLDTETFWVKVRDEGAGFDHRTFLSKASRQTRENLTHGRGITMALSAFDEVHYNESGNAVHLQKSLRGRLGIQERLRLKIHHQLSDRDIEAQEQDRLREAARVLPISNDWGLLDIKTMAIHPVKGPSAETSEKWKPLATLPEPEFSEVPIENHRL